MKFRRVFYLLALVSLLIAVGGWSASAHGAHRPTRASDTLDNILPGWQVPLRAGHATRIARVPQQTARLASTQPATIQVSYHEFSPQAQAAFQYAVDIWKTQISSPVPIQIDATWAPLASDDLLGSAGVADFRKDFPNAPVANTWYPIGLANKLSGQDLAPAKPDIFAIFNSNRDDWYFGTDGQTPLNDFDFATTVLHELGHGLGFIGSMNVSSAQGQWGVFSNSFTGAPFIFDRFAVNKAGQQLINTSLFPNPSAALAAQLTSNGIFFDGPNTRAVNAGIAAQLYAPEDWQDGSSFTHLDESTYGSDNANSLMTPILMNGESIHDPGPIIRGVFADMGWTIVATTLQPSTYLPLVQRK